VTRRQRQLHVVLQWVLLVALVGLLNHIGSAVFGRVDLTRDQRHSLSDAAVDAVSDLDRPLLARVYFTEGMKAPYHDHRAAVLEKLETLRAWSGGRLEIYEVDPSTDRELAEEARRFGIRPVTYVYADWGGREAKQVFMGVSFVYGDAQQAVPALPSLVNLEYELVRAIHTVTTPADERKTVAIAEGFGMPNLFGYGEETPVIALLKELVQRFSVQRVKLDELDALPEEGLDAIIIPGPQEVVSEQAQRALHAYVLNGGRVFWLVSGIQPDFEGMRTRAVDHGLGPLLHTWGVTVTERVLLDRTHREETVVPVVAGDQRRLARVRYPLVPTTTALERDYVPVRDVKRLVLPFSTTLVADPPEGVTADVWARSSEAALTADAPVSLDIQALHRPLPGEVAAQQDVVVALSGRMPSHFPDAEIQVGRPTRMVVVPSVDALSNNGDFVLNALDWLMEDETLVSIRSRGAGFEPLPEPENPWTLRAAMIVPSLVVVGLLLMAPRWRV
jgi:hypothetical protein